MGGKGLNQSVTVNLEGNLARRSKAYEKALGRMAKRGEKHLTGLGRAAGFAGRGLDRLGNRYVGLLTGAAAVSAAAFVVRFDKKITQLGVDTGTAAEQMDALKKKIFEVANSPDIRVDVNDLLEAVVEITKKTGQLSIAEDNLRNIGLTMRATDSAGIDIGATVANMFDQFDIKKAEDMAAALNVISAQGNIGSFELKDFSTQMNELASAYASSGRKGKLAVRELGAMMQMVRRTSSGAAEASTNFQRMMDSITIKGASKLIKNGITIYDPVKMKRGIKEFRAAPDIIKDIIKATKGDEQLLSQVFDIRGLKAMRSFANEFKSGKGFELFDKFLNIETKGDELANNSARNAKTMSAALDSLSNSWKTFSDLNLSKPLQDFADVLGGINEEQAQLILGVAKYSAGFVLAAYGAKKMFGLYRAGAAKFGKGGFAKGAGGLDGLVKAGKPIPVFVVNNGMGGRGGAGGGRGGGRGARGGAAGKGLARSSSAPGRNMGGLARMAPVAGGVVAPVLFAGAAGYVVGTEISKAIEGTGFSDALGEAVAYLMAFGGNQNARNSILANRRADAEARSTLKIEIVGDVPVRVRELKSEGMDIDIDAGPTMELP